MPKQGRPGSNPLPAHEGADGVAALERGFKVLDCFATARRPLGNSEVADMTGIPRPSVTRLIATLVKLGHVRPAEEADRWVLASGVVHLAQAFLGALDIRSYARPHMARLAEATGASCFLGLQDGVDMLVVEAVRARSAVAVIGSDVGTRMAIATSALGRAWMAGLDDAAYLAKVAELRQSGSALSARQLDKMGQAVRSARELGYARSLGDWHPNINAIGAAVRLANGDVVALNCGGPSFMLSAERIERVAAPSLIAAARALAADIGGSAQPVAPPVSAKASRLRAAAGQK